MSHLLNLFIRNYNLFRIVLPLFFISICSRVSAKPWEPYQENDFDSNMKSIKSTGDMIWGGIDMGLPMIKKMGLEKYDNFNKKYMAPNIHAGKAGATHSSEESKSDSGSNEEHRRKSSKKSNNFPPIPKIPKIPEIPRIPPIRISQIHPHESITPPSVETHNMHDVMTVTEKGISRPLIKNGNALSSQQLHIPTAMTTATPKHLNKVLSTATPQNVGNYNAPNPPMGQISKTTEVVGHQQVGQQNGTPTTPLNMSDSAVGIVNPLPKSSGPIDSQQPGIQIHEGNVPSGHGPGPETSKALNEVNEGVISKPSV